MSDGKAKIAILIKEVVESRNFANIFNQMGVIPKCYDDLDVFWHGINNEKISMAIIDVQMMSKGETILKNHPKIKNEELPVVFYFSEESSPLLISTYEILNFGLIEKSTNYSGQLKSVLKRVNQFWNFKTSEKSNILKSKENEEKLKDLASVKIYNSFLQQEGDISFFQLAERVFENWSEIIKYSYFIIEKDGKKITSPKEKGLKYLCLGEIDQKRSFSEGIDPLGQKECYEIAQKYYGKEIVALKISIQRKYPELIIILKAKSTTESLSWENLEKFLTGVYARYKLKENFFQTRSKEFIGPWELFDLLDENLLIYAKKLTLMDLNLHAVLFSLARDNIFDWKVFLSDFMGMIKKRTSIEFFTCIMAYNRLAFLTDWQKGSQFFDLLHVINEEFPYYNYFQNKEVVLKSGAKGKLRMIPSSVKSYLKILMADNYETKEINAF